MLGNVTSSGRTIDHIRVRSCCYNNKLHWCVSTVSEQARKAPQSWSGEAQSTVNISPISTIMNVCGKLQIPPPCPFPRPRSWLVSTLDAVKLLIKIHNSVMPGGDQDSSDETAFCLKVSTVGIAEITRQACTYTVQINVPFVKISLELQYFIFPLQSHVETYA